MLGKVIPIVTETAEVDHLAQPGSCGGGSEPGRTLSIPHREVLDSQRVHEIVGDLLAIQRPAQALRIADSAYTARPAPV